MNLPAFDLDDLQRLRLKTGDLVTLAATVYVVDQVGLKYATLALYTDPRQKGIARLSELVKLTAIEQPGEDTAEHLMQEFPSLSRR